MAQDSIEKITAAEAEAVEIVARAEAEAKHMLSDAEREGQTAVDAASDAADAEVQAMLARAEDQAAGASLEITATAERECEKLRILAKGRMKDAAAFIAEKVVKG